MRRYSHKTDSNQSEIVRALRAAGASVEITSRFGGGFPDLLVTYRYRIYLLEIKRPTPPSARKLTDDELEFARRHPVYVVTTVSEALAVIGVEAAA